MLNKITFINIILLISCGQSPKEILSCIKGCPSTIKESIVKDKTCSVKEIPEGAAISCADGTIAVIANGQDGQVGPKGEQGTQGAVGPVGAAGVNGDSCSIVEQTNGSVIECTDGTTTVLVNGQNGQDGQNGEPALINIHDPCGDGPGYDELILELGDGRFIAWYQDLGMVELLPGVMYRTTDEQACKFTLEDLTVESEG